MDAISGRRGSHDWYHVGAARDDVESAPRDVGAGSRWVSSQQFLWRRASEMAHAMEVNDLDRTVRGGDGRLHSVEHSGGNDEHRNSVRVCDRLRCGDGDAQNESQCESSLPRAIRSAGSNPRNRYLPAADVLAALRELGPSYRLAGGGTRDLFRVWSPSQRDGAPHGP